MLFQAQDKKKKKKTNFDEKRINKINIYKNKKSFKIYIYVNKILVSKKVPDGKKSSLKQFFGYNENDDIIPYV